MLIVEVVDEPVVVVGVVGVPELLLLNLTMPVGCFSFLKSLVMSDDEEYVTAVIEVAASCPLLVLLVLSPSL